MEVGPKNVSVLDGKDATITCQAAGAPIPNVTWIYNGKFLSFHDNRVSFNNINQHF